MSERSEFWKRMEGPAPPSAVVAGTELRRGSRVRLAPRAGGDVLDLALAGRSAIVEGIDQDQDGNLHLAVTLEDDPGRDLGEERYVGHRFFFSPAEVVPDDGGGPAPAPGGRILVAGIGNVFLGDDGFGVEVAHRLADRRLPAGVKVVDFGIRGIDLAYALQDDYAVAILVDATPRGDPPGTVYVIEPDIPDEGPVTLDTHGMHPARVLALARAMGGLPERILIVGCEPAALPSDDGNEDVVSGLSRAVRTAVPEALRTIESLIEELTAPEAERPSP